MDLMANLWHGLLTSGLPLISAANNPRIYPFALGAIALTLALTIVRLVQTRRASTLLGAVFGLPVIELAWLGFSTPVDHLFGFTPSGATAIAAEIVHGVLALLPLVLVVIWQLQLGRSPLSLWGMAIELGVCGLLVAGIELQSWPGDLVAALEALISVVVFFALAFVVAKIVHNATLWRALTLASFGVWGAVLVLLLFAHTIQSPLVALCLLFLAIVCLDGLTGTGAWRFVVTVPLVLAVGVLGAANVFAPYSLAPGLSSSIWLEAASAGAVFLFVAALFDWAEHQIDKHLTDAEKSPRDDQFGVVRWLIDQLAGRAAARQRHLEQVKNLAGRLKGELDGITAAFFFTILVAYYLVVYFAAYLTDPVPLLRPIVGATLITLAGFALNQYISKSVRDARKLRDAPRDGTLGDPIFKPVWKIVNVFFFLVLALYGLGGQLGSVITQGDCSDPGNKSCVLIDQLNGLTHTTGVAPLALLGNGSFWIAAGRIALGAALVMLAVGQGRFGWVVNKVKNAEAGSTSTSESAGAGADKGTATPAARPAAAQPAATAGTATAATVTGAAAGTAAHAAAATAAHAAKKTVGGIHAAGAYHHESLAGAGWRSADGVSRGLMGHARAW